MNDKHKPKIIYDEKGTAIPPLVTFIEAFIKPVMEAEEEKNPRKIEVEIPML